MYKVFMIGLICIGTVPRGALGPYLMLEICTKCPQLAYMYEVLDWAFNCCQNQPDGSCVQALDRHGSDALDRPLGKQMRPELHGPEMQRISFRIDLPATRAYDDELCQCTSPYAGCHWSVLSLLALDLIKVTKDSCKLNLWRTDKA